MIFCCGGKRAVRCCNGAQKLIMDGSPAQWDRLPLDSIPQLNRGSLRVVVAACLRWHRRKATANKPAFPVQLVGCLQRDQQVRKCSHETTAGSIHAISIKPASCGKVFPHHGQIHKLDMSNTANRTRKRCQLRSGLGIDGKCFLRTLSRTQFTIMYQPRMNQVLES